MADQPIDRNVYILGAGFSATAGVPLIYNFLDSARKFYRERHPGLDEVERSHFERVFQFRQEMAKARDKMNIDLDDIEQLFGLVEISHRLGESPRETRESTVYLIAKTIELAVAAVSKRPLFDFGVESGCFYGLPIATQTSRFQLSQDQGARDVRVSADCYDFFAAITAGLLERSEGRPRTQDTIITFDYDLVCDDSLRRVGVSPLYHLDPSLTGESTPDAQKLDHRNVPLLKLHGSTNWGVCTRCKRSLVILTSKMTETPSELRTLTCGRCNANAYQPLLVPPSWDKSEYQEIIQPVWQKAVEEMKSATRICLIGYSLPDVDAFFKYLLGLALSQNSQLSSFIVVDYLPPKGGYDYDPARAARASEVERRYRKLLDTVFQERRFFFFKQGFVEYLRSFQSRTTLERGQVITGDLSYY